MPAVYNTDIPNIEGHQPPTSRRAQSRGGQARVVPPAARRHDVHRRPGRRGGGGFGLFFVTFVAASLVFLAIWPESTFKPHVPTPTNSDHSLAPEDQRALSLEVVASRVWEAARDRLPPLVPAGRALIDDLVQQEKRAERYVRRMVGRIAEVDTRPAVAPAN